MEIIRLITILVVCLAVLIGCSDEKIENKDIYQKTLEINQLIKDDQWSKAEDEGKEIINIFKKNKWKYQLLGDESEYQGLDQEILKLQISIEEKDRRESKTNIAIIQDYIRAIYFK